MPSVIIHEKIGEYISEKIGISSYDYYLGLLAPDTPNLEGFAPKEERWTAHQRNKDYKEWKNKIRDFYQKEKPNYPHDFILGYYIHVITDIVYDEYLYAKVREKIERDYATEEAHKIMRLDMEKYSFEEQNKIKQILQDSNISYNILNISSERLQKWKQKEILSWENENHCKYITKEIIEELSEKVWQEIKK